MGKELSYNYCLLVVDYLVRVKQEKLPPKETQLEPIVDAVLYMTLETCGRFIVFHSKLTYIQYTINMNVLVYD